MRVLITALLIGLALGSRVESADDSKSKEQIWEGTLKVRAGGGTAPDRARDGPERRRPEPRSWRVPTKGSRG